MPDIKQIANAFADFLGKKLDNVGVEIKGVSVMTLKGDQGEKGDPGLDGLDGRDSVVPGPKGDKGEPGNDGKDGIGKNGRDGKDGKNGKDGIGKDGRDGKNGKDGSPDTGEEIIDKINKDKSKKIIRKEKVEGLAEIEDIARSAEVNSRWRGGGSFVYDYDLSDLLDGSKKTFPLPQNAHVIAVFGSSTPGVFRKTTDYTTTASSITFTSQIDASTTLSSGQTVVLIYKIL